MSIQSSIPVVPAGMDPIGRWCERTFRAYREQLQVWLMQGLIYAFVMTVVSVIAYMLLISSGIAPSLLTLFQRAMLHPGARISPQDLPSPQAMLADLGSFMLVLAVFMLIYMLIAAFFVAGMTRTAVKHLRGEPAEITDLFSEGNLTWSVFGGRLISGLLIVLSAMCCLVPALFVAPVFVLLIPLIVDGRRGIFAAISDGYALLKQNYWLFFIYTIVAWMLINAVSMVVSLVCAPLSLLSPIISLLFRILVTAMLVAPFEVLLFTVPYVDIFYHQGGNGGNPPTGPLPYLPPAYQGGGVPPAPPPIVPPPDTPTEPPINPADMHWKP